MFKRIAALLLSVSMVAGLAACSNTTTTTSTAPDGSNGDDATASDYKVAMITDYGDITDQSFNQTTYEACKAFCDANNIQFSYYKPNGDNTAERVAMVDAAVADGYNVIVMPGYAFGGTIVEASEQYPEVKFVALDVAAGDILEAGVPLQGEEYDYNPDNWNVKDYYYSDNVYCAVYQEELCGYMAGYAAVKLGYTHLGFLGGMAVPAVMRYGYGFVQGVDAAAAELGIGDSVTVEYVYGNQFNGDADITSYMDNWYQTLGVEVVFACGGGIYTSAAEAAAKVDGKVIGVDVDQAAIIDAYGAGMTVTSAMKGLAPTTQHILEEIILNDNWSSYAGQIETLGLVSGDDPEANYVQLPMESTQWDDNFTQDNYKDLVAAMFDGEITVSNDTTVEPEANATVITVNPYGNIK
ncbi:BMP family ABC transporter substrate-binding protein [Pseudoflavonifractor phocaeensis]|uniref:BMP family lipoprotein n=1 Tax=Pseudoflavonifractor phocaeensis TaxID=1870988 RepID=UPI0019564DA3|nr:BMP family ABC transporter substrate-binding protein [Pseudoflavonifractor phocaeensis]MBM6871150.1 BMP family ABC transporter substrate-binding protein [Pseudoflavonifractor phocaeensis]MBM6939108.1 BMP family ABC transporter substrate-binding protein [Pseudoflavonifractor phocaeensis]